MNLSHSRLIGVAAAAALGTVCFAAQSQSASDSEHQEHHQQSSQQQSNQKAPEGFVLVRESVITLTANEPQNHFIRAQELLAHGDRRAAAAETRIGAAYLDMQASRDQGGSAGELESAADNLRKIARELQQESGQKGQSQASGQSGQSGQHADKQLTEAFARANHALAAHFQSMAQQELQGHKRFKAGYDLDAAASALRASCVWAGQQPSPQTASAVSDAHRAADELLSARSGRQQSNQQAQSKSSQNANEEEAEPAAARFSGSDQGQSAQENASPVGQQDTQLADRAAQELGKAIQSEKVPGESGQSSGASADHQSSSSGQNHGSSSGSNSSPPEKNGK